jgi:RimJ/RimL family protein N-acetyltransferase
MQETTPISEAGPLDRVEWPVRTDRLAIRPVRLGDSEAMWAYRRLEEVSRWLTYRPADRDDWESLFAEPKRLASTLAIELDGRVIGDLYLKVEDGWAQREVEERGRGVQAEIGWCLDPAHTGHGYATEAAAALLRICFADLGLRRVVANAFADNEASWRLMERLGMRREQRTVRDSLHRDLGWVDGVCYALLADEWRGKSD